jgi:hypothetical protein
LGSEEFRQERLSAAAERGGASHYGRDRWEAAEAQARRRVAQELKRLGWDDKELGQRRKGDEGKVQVACRLRKETTLSLKWIAQELQMGSCTYVAHLLTQVHSLNSKD